MYLANICQIKLKQSDNICVLLTLQLTDLATEIIKYANLRTHIRKINAADSSENKKKD